MRYDLRMHATNGPVIDGKAVLQGVVLPGGTMVSVRSNDLDAVVLLSLGEEAELLTALDEADQARCWPVHDVLERLRKCG
jgi:hypothetical protein